MLMGRMLIRLMLFFFTVDWLRLLNPCRSSCLLFAEVLNAEIAVFKFSSLTL
jgi:hypothetical protein